MRVFALSGGYAREEASARLKAGMLRSVDVDVDVVYQVFYTIHENAQVYSRSLRREGEASTDAGRLPGGWW